MGDRRLLTLRDDQLRALEAVTREGLIDRAVAHVHRACPEHVRAFDEAGLRTEVDTAIEHAGRYELEDERDVLVFVECRIELGSQFDTRVGWAAEILTNASLFPDEKADYLSDRALYLFEPEAP